MPRSVPGVLRFLGLAKKKYRPLADLICTYGIGIVDSSLGPGPHPYEITVGLWQNAERSELRQAARTLFAIRQAFAEKQSRAFWEAICDSPEQANEAMAIEEAAVAAAKDSIGTGE